MNFLSDENINFVIQTIISQLISKGYQIDAKSESDKIRKFMGNVGKQHPTSNIQQLNNFVINNVIDNLKKNLEKNKQLLTSPNDRFLQEQNSRNYDSNQPFSNNNQIPTDNQFNNQFPNDNQYNDNNKNNIPHQLPDQLRSVQTRNTRVDLSDKNNQHNNRDTTTSHTISDNNNTKYQNDNDNIGYQNNSDITRYQNNNNNSNNISNNNMNYQNDIMTNTKDNTVFISLDEKDIINIDRNKITFAWNSSKLPNSRKYFVQIKQITLPLSNPFVLIKYSKNNNNIITSNSKYSYDCKMIAKHTNLNNTIYESIGNPTKFDTLPLTFTIELKIPTENIKLNEIMIKHVTKQNNKIYIQSTKKHFLDKNDQIILEFVANKTCYKITDLNIIDMYNFEFDSPFVGYFDKEFNILRSNWSMDMTLQLFAY